MRQRAMIAVALSCNPKVLLADEPTTALDVTVQIQILLLLRELQRELGMAVVFVTHDVGAAVEISDRLAVMYGGRFVETGDVRQIMRNPAHPYTQGLLAANLHGVPPGDPADDNPGRAPEPRGTAARLQFRPALRLRAPGLRHRPASRRYRWPPAIWPIACGRDGFGPAMRLPAPPDLPAHAANLSFCRIHAGGAQPTGPR